MPVIRSKGFVLRHIRMSDLKGYFECQRDKAAKRGFMHVSKNISEARKDIEETLSDMSRGRGEMFAIIADGEFAGYVELHDMKHKNYEHKAVIGFCLNKKFRGKGIATTAVKLVTAYAFRRYKLKRIEGWCRTFNKASAGVFKRAGYKLEGILRKNKFRNGKYLDDMIWAKIK